MMSSFRCLIFPFRFIPLEREISRIWCHCRLLSHFIISYLSCRFLFLSVRSHCRRGETWLLFLKDPSVLRPCLQCILPWFLRFTLHALIVGNKLINVEVSALHQIPHHNIIVFVNDEWFDRLLLAASLNFVSYLILSTSLSWVTLR